MRDFSYDFVYLPRARRDYDELAPSDQEEVDRLVDVLCEDPSVDGVQKLDFPMPPAILRLFDNGTWSIIYNVTEPFVIQLWTIARTLPGSPPVLRR